MKEGYIKLYRQFLDWEWFTDINTCHFFLYCLLRANHSPKKWRGQSINTGEFISSYQKMASDTGLTIQNIRTSIKRLKSTQELTCISQGSNSLITIKNWNKFQETNILSNNELTSNQQGANKELTTNKNDKNDKNDKNNTTTNFKIFGKFQNVALTSEQYQKLLGICISKKLLDELIDSLSENIETGDEHSFRGEFPNTHFIRLQKYREYRIKNPERFAHSVRGASKPAYSVRRADFDPTDRKHIFEELEAEAKAKGVKIV